jgi:DNA topoisomerase I
MKTLLIVESPTKARKIQEYLGADYIVLASMGHIADLKKQGLGVDIDKDFRPRYVLLDDKVQVLTDIMTAAESCDRILLAPDPDREGEAIAQHLWSRLEDLRKPIKRVVFNEITKKAIIEALKSPRDIDIPLFRSQEARRILDRLVGFMASPFLMNFFGSGLSAGRVQSVVTKMVVDREREIESFKPEEYWVIQANLANSANESFLAKYEPRITNAVEAQQIKTELLVSNFFVLDIDASEEKKKPNPPLITAKLQQLMSKQYGMSPDRTMKAAQSLYENGHITYMRTDSIRVSDEAIKDAREWLKANNYPVPKTANRYKNKEAAQDAHECIRPTDLAIGIDGWGMNNNDEKQVYGVIWRCFLASQMNPAIYNTLKVIVGVKDNPKHTLKASGKALKSKGFLAIIGAKDESKIEIPNLTTNELLHLVSTDPITAEQRFTQPPARFSEAHLIETLEKKNIGRPATFAELLSKITLRNYVEKQGTIFYPTDLGKQITDELTKFFSFMHYTYTAEMEDKLDQIATGQVDHLQMLRDFFIPFQKELHSAYFDHGSEICPKCQGPMMLRNGNGNQFFSCIHYPSCRGSKSIAAPAPMSVGI